MQTTKNALSPITLRHANAQMLSHYMPWVDYMLTLTFGKPYDLSLEPTYEQTRDQLRHLCVTLNRAIWRNRTNFNAKCRILYIPIIEGATSSKRIHAHVLVGNVKSRAALDAHMTSYVERSRWLLPRYDIKEVYDPDGVSWYVSKETSRVNQEAIEWEIASIPKPLMP